MPRKLSGIEMLKVAGVTFAALAATEAISWIGRKPTNEVIERLRERDGLMLHNGLAGFMHDRGVPFENEGKHNEATNRIYNEVIKYPPGMLYKHGVQDIYIAGGFGIGGHAYSEERAVLVPGEVDILTRYFASVGDIANHEFYHVIESEPEGVLEKDDVWRDFHEDAECSPYSQQTTDEEIGLSRCKPEFYEHPFQSSWWALEDRAFWAMKIMNPYDHRLLLGKIEKTRDPVLKEVRINKFQYIIKSYLDLSDGVMDEKYWRDLTAGKVDEKYFT